MAQQKKRIQLCFLETCCTGGYMAAGQWRRPDDHSRTKDTLKYYTDLAKLAERGKISAIFFADWYAGFEVYGDSMDAMLRAGHQVAHLDPLPVALAMAAVTESLAIAVTMSTSYVKPYVLARFYSTLDHLTGGRIAWNVVTSWARSAANALGHEDVVPHDERYAVADEYMDVVYKLWESSWAPDATVWDIERGIAYDPSDDKVKKIEHKGKYFNLSGRSQVHPSPQRTPVIFQAGASKTGTAFAAKHAEAIFLNTATLAQAKQVIANARQVAREGGRDPRSLKFFPCIVPFIGRTAEEAKAKYDCALKFADPIAGLGQFSGYTGIDMAQFPLDESIDLTGHGQAAAIQSVFKALSASGSDQGTWTPRKLGIKMALGGLHPTPIGSAKQVADVFEEWSSELGADCDGFNVSSVTNPGSWQDVVELLVPELQRRGIYWDDYDVPGGTFRENLLGSKHLCDDHYGSSFKWPKEGPSTAEKEANSSASLTGIKSMVQPEGNPQETLESAESVVKMDSRLTAVKVT